MAVFQKIRDNSLLSLIVVGGGLVLFIVQDAVKSSPASIESSIGEFEGNEISIDEYDTYFSNILYLNGNRNSASSLSDQEKQNYSVQTWNQIIREKIFGKESAENGITVPETEVEEMMVGENLSRFYLYRLFEGEANYKRVRDELALTPEDFSDPKFTGGKSQYHAEMLKDFGVSLRKEEKLTSLLKHSFYTTKSEAKAKYKGKYENKNITVVSVPYYLVADSLVNVTDTEVKDFYAKNKGKYKVENASKKVIYGAYNIDPSAQDDADVKVWADETVVLFQEEENDELFVRSESEEAFDNAFHKKEDGLPGELDKVLFDKEVGFVYGPYTGFKDGNKTYNVAKIVDSQNMPDSAKVSSILLSVNREFAKWIADGTRPTQEDQIKAFKAFDDRADSVYNAVENGASFSKLAVIHSADTATSNKGGDLGWIQEKSTSYGKAFLDSVFFESTSSSKFKKVRINTNDGGYYYRVIRLDEMGPKSKKIKVGVVTKSVEPGAKTRNSFFNKINQVAIALNEGQDLISLKDSFNLLIDSVDVQAQQYIVNDLTGGRKLVYWAFNESVDGQSEVFDLDREYIVALVKGSKEKGFKSWKDKDVKGELKQKVLKAKKAVYIANKLGELDAAKIKDVPTVFAGATVVTKENVVPQNGIPN